jgi:NitT/TauT family transport system substrate-binding protein
MSPIVSRGAALFGIAAAASSFAIPRTASAEPTLLRANIIPIFDVAPMYAANAQGYFTAENLSVTTEAITTGAVGIPALVSGAFDVAYSNSTSVLAAIAQGLDLRIILEGAVTQPKARSAVALFARKGEPLKSGKDFEGKTIAINGIRNVQWMVMRTWVKETGGNPDKVEYLELPLPAMLEAIKTKRVDAALLIDPLTTLALTDPAVELVDYIFKRSYRGGATAFWVTTGQMVAQRLQTIRGFQRAYKSGIAWCDANIGKPTYVDLLASYTHLEPALITRMQLGAFITASVTPSSVTKLQQLMVENGLLQKPLDLTGKIVI